MTKIIRAHNELENGPRPKDQLPHARLHDLRHIHATTLLLSGVPVHVVAARLGHADPAITLRVYAHVIRTAEPAAADIFAQAVNTPEAGCDGAEGKGWAVSADSTVVRAHQHAAGARRALPAELATGGAGE